MVAERQVYYAEQEGEATYNADTNYQTRVTLQFTPDANSTYLIIASGLIQESSASYYVKARLYNNTSSTVLFENIYYPKDVTDYVPCGQIVYETFGASPSQQTYYLQYGTSNTAGTARIKNARLIAIKLTSDDQFNSSTGRSTTTSTSDQSKVQLQFTPATAGDYLLLLSATYDGSSTSYDTKITFASVVRSNVETVNAANRRAWGHIDKVSLPASQQTYNLYYSTENASNTAGIAYAYIVALRLDGFLQNIFASGDGEVNNNFAALTTPTGAINGVEYVMVGSYQSSSKSTNSSSQISFYQHATLKGTSSLEMKDTSNYEGYLFGYKTSALEYNYNNYYEVNADGYGKYFRWIFLRTKYTTTTDTKTPGLVYRVKFTPSTTQLTLGYKVLYTPSAKTLGLVYVVNASTFETIQKDLGYKVLSKPSKTPELVYRVLTTPTPITSSLVYRVKTFPSALESALAYKITYSPTEKQVALVYRVLTTPTTTEKALAYKVAYAPATITPALAYKVLFTPTTIQKSLGYSVLVDQIEIEKKVGAGEYSVLTTQAWGSSPYEDTGPFTDGVTYCYRARRKQTIDGGTPSYSGYSNEDCVVYEAESAYYTIQKSLGYKVSWSPSTTQKALAYKVNAPATPITKALAYKVNAPATPITKSLAYKVNAAATPITKSLLYLVNKAATPITKALNYLVASPATPLENSLTYRVKTTTIKTPALVYRVLSYPSEITKSLLYRVTTTGTKTPALAYRVFITPTIQIGLAYVVYVPGYQTIQKSLEYRVRYSPATTEKGLVYRVKTTGSKTPALAYRISFATTSQKPLKYCVPSSTTKTPALVYRVKIIPSAIQKSLDYSVKSLHTATPALSYKVRVVHSITRDLDYAVSFSPSTIEKSLAYKITRTTTDQKSLRYTVFSTTTVQKPLEYVVTTSYFFTIQKGLGYEVRLTTPPQNIKIFDSRVDYVQIFDRCIDIELSDKRLDIDLEVTE